MLVLSIFPPKPVIGVLTVKAIDPNTHVLGDMRVVKHKGIVLVQEAVAGGWEYTQLHNKQTLTSCHARLRQLGYSHVGRDAQGWLYYSKQVTLLLADGGMWSTSGYHLVTGIHRVVTSEPTTGEE